MLSILIVDDDPDNFDVVETCLIDENYHLHYAYSGQDALSVINVIKPDLILLDVMMPVMDGIEVCRRIKAMGEWKGTPIIMVTALSSTESLAECLGAGADDFIAKPVNGLELLARIRSMLRIKQQYQLLADFNTKLELMVEERTAQLQRLIDEDTLTQLPSRAQLLHKLSDSYVDSSGENYAIAYLDCDQFKLVNGAFGYQVGNQLLRAIAERLKKHLRPGDILCRVGEDEFCFWLKNISATGELTDWINGVMGSFIQAF